MHTIQPRLALNLDPSFGQGGQVILDAALLGGLQANSIYSLALNHRDGSMRLASSDLRRQAGLVIGLRADGSLDPRLGGCGHVRVGFEGHRLEEGVAVQEMDDGRLLFTAWLEGEGEGEALWVPGFAMLNPDGSLDRRFGDNGITVVPFDNLRKAASPRMARTRARNSQDSCIVQTAAHFIIPFVVNDEQTFVIRLLANGQLDTGYHAIGYQEITAPQGQPCELPAFTTLQDGRMLLSGRCEAMGRALIVALTADGEIDRNFADQGVATLDVGNAQVLSITQTQEHGLLINGFINSAGLLASLLPDGQLDPRFNSGSPLVLPAQGTRLRLERVAIGLDGLVCGVGQDHQGVDSTAVLSGHDLVGKPLPGFGASGTLHAQDSHGFWDLKLQRDGKWLAAGSHRPSRTGMVCRYILG